MSLSVEKKMSFCVEWFGPSTLNNSCIMVEPEKLPDIAKIIKILNLYIWSKILNYQNGDIF